MPIYHYECKTCGAVETIRAKMSDDPPERLTTCDCEDPQPEKVPVAGSFTLRGSGWYKDGYR